MTSYRVDTRRIEHSLAGLRREHERSRPSRSQRRVFNLLQIAVYAVPVSLFLLWLVEDLAGATTAGLVAQAVVLLVLALALLSLVPLLALNLPLIRTLVRQVRLERNVAALLGDSGPDPWQAAGRSAGTTPRTRRGRVRRRILLGVGWLMVAVVALYLFLSLTGDRDLPAALAVAVLLAAPVFFVFSRRRVPFRVLRICLWAVLALLAGAVVAAWAFPRTFGWFGLAVVTLVCVLPLLLLVSTRLLARIRERLRLLEDAQRLHRSLTRQYRQAAEEQRDFVELPTGDAERLADLESRLNQRSRMVAIDRAEQQRSAAYTTLRTQALRSRMAELAPRTRLRVESKIEQLSFDPGVETASEVEDGVRRLPVADTGLELVYLVDDAHRQVNVLAVERTSGFEGLARKGSGHD